MEIEIRKKEQYKEHLGIVPSKLDSFTGLLIQIKQYKQKIK